MAPVLDRVVAVYRMGNNPLSVIDGIPQPGQPRESKQVVASTIRAAIVPISSFTAEQPYARESTHVVWVEPWLLLRLQDEIRAGVRDRDDYNDVQPERYIINGRRVFTGIGPRAVTYYARAME